MDQATGRSGNATTATDARVIAVVRLEASAGSLEGVIEPPCLLKGTKLPLDDGVNGDDAKLMSSFPYIADPESGFANGKGLQKP